jgi:DUF4097 and DUF4098 domain-containing protein YvlB
MTRYPLVYGALLTLAGCDLEEVGANSNKFTEDFHHSYAFQSGGRFELEGSNGPVEIYGWDQDKIEISGSKYASRKERLDEIKVEVAHTPGRIVIRSLRPVGRGGNWGVKYRIHVPRKIRIDRLATSNGALRLEGLEGPGRLVTSNGSVTLIAYQGDIAANTSNGRIRLERFTGSAALTTSNGSIAVRGIKGFIEARTSNGSVEVEAEALDPARPVRLETSNGPITLRLATGGKAGPEVRARTSNGSIEVKWPDGAGARLRAHASNNAVTSDYPLNNVIRTTKSHMEGVIGAGGPLLDLSTSNGPIRLLRE